MVKSELIEKLAESSNISKSLAETVVNIIFDSMVEELKRGKPIEIRGFGSFRVRNYSGYTGRNPRTGDKVDVDAKKLPFFRAGKELRDRLNDQAG
ncbi:MAG TPA: HU family DNA-binding protein [Thermodesulfobacteriota bacterium]|nr:integration host factor subunit beta [Deltaproteobacteria bacterium]HNR11999.1 HU family DNA-binding protein [Thermodesulfobacteriota bacterium]HNU72738.1 HU family DNA-binding protein [Thermodesulfobacteriota bacterium]HOC38624.1 HU family DNA-binding protein [Thermodesulfobacteriota bacterium]HQO78020.1 HU family DNA-binding protein [Thermodesulfobacteriota bacterium]